MSSYNETWQLNKPAVSAGGGVVVSQHYTASRIGAAVLEAGGNAMDAAIAAGFAIGTVEPWMSGLGGCGNLLFHDGSSGQTHAVSFGVRASDALNPVDYPLKSSDEADSDLFGWPSVVDDSNVFGPRSIAVPGYVAGMNEALSRFGSWPLEEVLQPAIGLAREGMAVDWYASLKISSQARSLSQFESARNIFLPDGFAPVGEWGGPLPRIEITNLAATLERLAKSGAADFYTGEIARSLVKDAADLGANLTATDLENYRVTVTPSDEFAYRQCAIHTVPGMTAGPTLQHALSEIENHAFGDTPVDADFGAYTSALITAYAHRLKTMGDVGEGSSPSCTTHLSVTDRHGNVVALTQTLLSLFGSKVVFPGSGVTMNNGVMWFDPRPGRPNSMAPSKWPLSNMCPAISIGQGKRRALGASGGRRIMPAVYQLLSFLTDHEMTIGEAAHFPRVDVSGSNIVCVDDRLQPGVTGDLPDGFVVERAPNGVYPALYACPNLAEFDEVTGVSSGAAYVASPWAEAAGAELVELV